MEVLYQFSLAVVVGMMVMLFEIVSAHGISCKDELGQNVDWLEMINLILKNNIKDIRFYVNKLPNQFPADGVTQGAEFVFIKADATNWMLSPMTVDLGNSLIGFTLAQAYANIVRFMDFTELTIMLKHNLVRSKSSGCSLQ